MLRLDLSAARCRLAIRFTPIVFFSDPEWIFVKRDTLDELLKRLRFKHFFSRTVQAILASARPPEVPGETGGAFVFYGPDGPSLGVTEARCFQDVDKWVRRGQTQGGERRPQSDAQA